MRGPVASTRFGKQRILRQLPTKFLGFEMHDCRNEGPRDLGPAANDRGRQPQEVLFGQAFVTPRTR